MKTLLSALAPVHHKLSEVAAAHIASDYEGEQFAPHAAANLTRVVCWKDVTVEMPDDETSVLVFVPDDSAPIWVGFHEDGKWRSPCGMPLSHRVTHWAHFPEPPALS